MKEKFALAIIVAAFSGAAFAGGQEGIFKQLDANADGYISQEEAQAMPDLEKSFSEADVNQDGKLDQAEFAQFEVEAGAQGTQPEGTQEGTGKAGKGY